MNFKYPDLHSGGVALGAALQHYRENGDTIVLGIVRGGVTLAHEVARSLHLPLDLVLLRPMMERLPGPPLCAACVAGTLVLDDELRAMADPPVTIEEIFVADALQAFVQRNLACRGTRAPVSIAGKTVLLVDNGLRTGGTMRSSIRGVQRLGPARIVAAVPVGSEEAIRLVRPLADELICLASPSPFGHVGMWYQRFDVESEAGIGRLLDEYTR